MNSAFTGSRSRRGLFAALSRTAVSLVQPTSHAEDESAHHDESRETQLVDGRLVSYLDWPDVPLTDHLGRALRIHSGLLRACPAIVAFFYTNCQGNCPGTLGKLAALASALPPDLTARTKIAAVTLDPARDTVPVLQQFAADTFSDAQPDWRFLTGELPDITKLRRWLGFYDSDPRVDAQPSRHAAMVLLGNDATHRWVTLPAAASLRQWRSAFLRCQS